MTRSQLKKFQAKKAKAGTVSVTSTSGAATPILDAGTGLGSPKAAGASATSDLFGAPSSAYSRTSSPALSSYGGYNAVEDPMPGASASTSTNGTTNSIKNGHASPLMNGSERNG